MTTNEKKHSLTVTNVNWAENELTVVLTSNSEHGIPRAEAMALVDKLERYLSSEMEVVSVEEPVKKGRKARASEEPKVEERPVPAPVEEPTKQMKIEEVITPAAPAPSPVPPEDDYKLDMGGRLDAAPLPEIAPEDREAEDEMAFGVFEDSLKGVNDPSSAVRVWLESQELFKRHPSIRDRARLVIAGHLAKAMNITPVEAGDKIKELLVERQRLMQGSAPVPTSPAPTPEPVVQEDPKAAGFLKALTDDPAPKLGTAVKLACMAKANDAREVTRDLVQDFLLGMVGKHPLLTSADEIRAVLTSTRFPLFAAAGKVKVVGA